MYLLLYSPRTTRTDTPLHMHADKETPTSSPDLVYQAVILILLQSIYRGWCVHVYTHKVKPYIILTICREVVFACVEGNFTCAGGLCMHVYT